MSLSITEIRRLARSARERADRRAFVVEGPTLIDEAMRAGVDVLQALVADGIDAAMVDRWRAAGVDVRDVPASAIESVATTMTPQPALAVALMPAVAVDDVIGREGLVLLLDRVADPGNVGTILRSAEASGAAGVILGDDCVDVYNPKVVRASAGSLFRVPCVADVGLSELINDLRSAGRGSDLRSARRGIYATAADGADLYSRSGLEHSAVVLGSEAHGVSPELVALCDATIAIPQEGRIESLNVAMAATVICFEAQRRRRGGGMGGNELDPRTSFRQGERS